MTQIKKLLDKHEGLVSALVGAALTSPRVQEFAKDLVTDKISSLASGLASSAIGALNNHKASSLVKDISAVTSDKRFQLEMEAELDGIVVTSLREVEKLFRIDVSDLLSQVKSYSPKLVANGINLFFVYSRPIVFDSKNTMVKFLSRLTRNLEKIQDVGRFSSIRPRGLNLRIDSKSLQLTNLSRDGTQFSGIRFNLIR